MDVGVHDVMSDIVVLWSRLHGVGVDHIRDFQPCKAFQGGLDLWRIPRRHRELCEQVARQSAHKASCLALAVAGIKQLLGQVLPTCGL